MKRVLLIACVLAAALAALATAAAVLVERPRWEAYDRADKLVDKAQELASSGDIKGAVAAVREALALAPDNPRARREHGMQFVAAGRLHEALPDLKAVVKALPYDAGAARELGVVLAATGDLPGGVRWLRKATSLDPANGVTRGILGGYLREAGSMEEAGREGELGAKLAPQVPFVQFSLGLTRRDSGDLIGAKAAFDRALSLDPLNIPALFCAAGVAGRLHRPEEAITYLRRALELTPNDPIGWTALGEACRVANRPAEARQAFHKALQLNPNDPGAKAGLRKLASQ